MAALVFMMWIGGVAWIGSLIAAPKEKTSKSKVLNTWMRNV